MNPEGAAAAGTTQVYEDFVPTTELVQEQDSDILLINLTGFKNEQVRVQLTRTGILKIRGQRPVIGQNKSLRFQKDFPVSENCDKTKISRMFEDGILYIIQPKLIPLSEKKDQELPTANAQQPKKPADEPQPKKKDEEQAKGEKTPTPSPSPTPTPTEEVPRQQTNADKPEKEEPNTKEAKDLLPTANAQQPRKPADEPQPQKKDEEQAKGEKTPTASPTPTPTPTEEVPRQQTNADKPEKEEPNTKEAKDLLPTANAQEPKKPVDEPQPQKKDEEQAKGEKTPTPSLTPTPTEEVPRQQTNADKLEKEEPNTKEAKYLLPTAKAQQLKKPSDEPQPQKKDEDQAKGEKTPTASPTLTATLTEEVPRQQTNADMPEKEEPNTKEAKEEPNTKEAKDLPEQTPAEKTDANRPSYASKLENNAMIGTATALAEKLKMPRKVMNMSLIALLVLGIGLYVCRKTKK